MYRLICRLGVQPHRSVRKTIRFQATEDEIRIEMLRFLDLHDMKIEGAAGVALAAYTADRSKSVSGRCVVIICGGNVAADALEEWSDPS